MDDTTRVDCYVIADASSVKVLSLLLTLEKDVRLKVHRVNAIMLNLHSPDYLALKEGAERHFYARYGRMIFPGEVGCSISHNIARRLASKSNLGAVILEEDAEIINLERFVTTSINFLKSNENKSNVLSFFNNEFNGFRLHSYNRRKPWIRIFGNPSSTVAYALTPRAALKLMNANQPIRYLADWPTASVNYYISLSQDITHPPDPNLSHIGDRRLRISGFTIKHKLQILTGIHFLKNRETFSSFKKFLSDLWIPRLNNKLNRIYLTKLNTRRYFER